MLTFITAAAAAAAAQAAQPAPATPHAQHTPSGQMSDMRQTDHSGMNHPAMGQKADGCCKKNTQGKMECQMMKGHGGDESGQNKHQGHSGE